MTLNNFLNKESYLKELNTTNETFELDKSMEYLKTEEEEDGRNEFAGVFQLPKITN